MIQYGLFNFGGSSSSHLLESLQSRLSLVRYSIAILLVSEADRVSESHSDIQDCERKQSYRSNPMKLIS